MRQRKKRAFIYCWDGDDFGYLPERSTNEDLVKKVFTPLEGSAIDTVFFLLGSGNEAEYRSSFLQMAGEGQNYNFLSAGSYKRYMAVKRLLDAQNDPADTLINAARERNLDAS